LDNLYVFDLDGTLIDSSDQILSALNFTLVRNGFPEQASTDIFPLIGLPPADFLTKFDLLELEIERIVSEFRIKLVEISSGAAIFFPGAIEIISFLKKRGEYVSIATNKPTEVAKAILRDSAIWPQVDQILGTDGISVKPSPEILQNTIQNFHLRGVFPIRTIMIGDRNEDIECGLNAGAECVFLAHSGHILSEINSSAGAKSFDSINEYFKHLSEF